MAKSSRINRWRALVLTAQVCAALPLLGEDLIQNGSFEIGPALNGRASAPVSAGSRAIEGWLVTRQQIDYTGTEWAAADGLHSIDLEGSPGVGGVAQTFPTDPGRTYRVTFFLAGNPCSFTGPGIKRMAVRAGDQQAQFTFDTHGKTATNVGWVRIDWEFEARSEQTTLEFFALDGEWCGAAIDNVSVAALAAPFIRGDCDGDGSSGGTVGDAQFLLNFLFLGRMSPLCVAACDANGDGTVAADVTDAIYMLAFSFLGGPPPPDPYPECADGGLPGDEELGCRTVAPGCS